jgi:4-amino-4-deoxy-L-arabinose transferase-like glycosyltransferase
MKNSDYKLIVFLFLLGLLTFVPGIGKVHLFDWDEVNFAECSREMIETGDYTTVQIDYKPFWEKPPLFFWLQVLSMKTFGINDFAARLPNAVAGALVLVVLFLTGEKMIDEKFGIYYALSYYGAWLPFFYFKSGIIDPWFNLFIYLGIYFLMLLYIDKTGRIKNIVLSALFISMAILTKGPVGILILGLTYVFVLLFYHGIKNIIPFREMLLYAALVIVLGGSWFLVLIFQGKTDVILDFINYQIRLFSTQDAGHGGPFFYHFLVLLVGFFPFSLFAIKGMTKSIKQKLQGSQLVAYNWMMVLFWVVLILFSIVKTKIIHYSSMTYYPLAFFTALAFYKMTQSEYEKAKWCRILTVVIGILWSIGIAALPLVEKYKQDLLPFIKDEFARAALISVSVNWGVVPYFIGAFLLIAIFAVMFFVHKKNYAFILTTFISAFVIGNAVSYIVPRIEKYSQGSVINFYETKQGEDVYVYPLGFKSYAHLFYTRKPPYLRSLSPAEILRCNGGIKDENEKFIVVKINSSKEVEAKYHSILQKVFSKGGFVGYKVCCSSSTK